MKSRPKPRRLVLGDATYLWRISHRHRPGLPHRCTEVFTAFSAAHPRSPVRILFPETDQQGPGRIRERGVVVDHARGSRSLNLNRPQAARLLIEICLASGWAPDASRRELVVADGYQLLRQHDAEVDGALGEAGRSEVADELPVTTSCIERG